MEESLRSYTADPQTGCVGLEDRAALPLRRRNTRAKAWVLAEACRQASRIAGNVADHITGLERCLAEEPYLAHSPMTLSRAALDGAVRVCYLLDPNASLDTRLL